MTAPFYIISDNHFNILTNNLEKERRNKLFRVFDKIKKSGKGSLIIGGDFFDYWFEYKDVIPKGYEDILLSLKDLSQSGIEIHYILGNHDFWDFGYLSNQLGITVHKGDLSIKYNDKNILFTHGDGLLKSDYGYRFMKKIIRSKIFINIYKMFPPALTIKLATQFSKTSAHFNHHPYDKHIKEIKRDLKKFAESKWKNNYDMIFVGHYHQTGTLEKNKKSLTFLGDWLSKFTVTKLDEDGIWQGNWQNFLELS